MLAFGILAVCAVVVAGLAWTQPVRSTLVIPYTQHGQVSYSAPAAASSRYGARGVHSGQTVYANVVPSLTVDYAYDLSTTSPVALVGTEQLMATVSDGLGATRTIALQPQALHFVGSGFMAHGSLDMSQLSSAAGSLAQSAGTSAPANYVVSVSPSVSARGHLGGRPMQVAFDKSLAFSYTPASSAGPATLAPPGAGQAGTASGGGSSAPATGALITSTTGSLPIPGGASVKLFLGVNVLLARIVSLGVLAAALIVMWLLGRPLLSDASSDDERVRIATRYGSSLVQVEALPSSSRTAVVDLHSFEGLLRVSRRLECPLLECQRDGVYAVVDNGTLYRYSCRERERSAFDTTRNGHVGEPVSMLAGNTRG
jgi:hypothetical protein